MHSYRVLGVVALGAIVVAVICFTVVDISIDSANGCLASRSACHEHEVPSAAITYAVLGAIALLASIPPAALWVVGMLRRPEPAASAPRRVRRPLLAEDEL